MIGSSPRGSFPEGSYLDEGLPTLEYAVASTTISPFVAMQVNIVIDIAATTVVPKAEIAATMLQSMDVSATTSVPAVSMALASSRLFDIAAATNEPALAIDLAGKNSPEIAMTSPTPSVAMTLLQESLYGVMFATQEPSVSIALANTLAYDIAFSTASPSASMSLSEVLGAGISISAMTSEPLLLAMLTNDISAIVVASGVLGQTQTAICVNLSNGGHSTYTNFSFDKIITKDNEYYGSSNGIDYAFGGKTDDGAPIDWAIQYPVTDFGSPVRKNVQDINAYMRSDGDVQIKTYIDEEKERGDGDPNYIINHDGRNGVHRRRRLLPKGIVGTSWQIELRSINGSSLELNQCEVSAEKTQRVGH